MKNLSLPSAALIKRVLGLSAREQDGLTLQLAAGGGGENAQGFWSAWKDLLAKGQAIGAASLWQACMGDTPFHLPSFKTAIGQIEKALDKFLASLAGSTICQQLAALDDDETAALEAHILASESAHREEAHRLLLALLALIRAQEDFTRLDVWEAWQAGKPFDPNHLNNRLTTLQNLMDSHLASMDQTKVFKCLALLNARELGELRRFLLVLGDSRREEMIELLDLLIPLLSQEKAMLRRAFFALWRGDDAPFKDNILSSACNNLVELVRKFFAYKMLSGSPADEVLFQMRYLDQRDWSALFEQEHPIARRRLDTLPKDARSLSRAAALEEGRISQQNATGRNVKQPLDFADSLLWIEQDFLLNAFRGYAAAISHDRSLGTQHDLRRLPPVIAMAQSADHPLPYAVQSYLHVVLLLTETDPEPHFHALKEGLLNPPEPNSPEAIAPELGRELLKYAINHCARQLREGLLDYEETLADLYAHGMEKRLLFHHDLIDAAELKNLITFFCRAGRLALAQTTWQENRHRLASGTDVAVPGFLEGVLHFWAGDLAAARVEFQQALSAQDIFVKFESRLYLLEIRWLNEEFVPDGPAMVAPFETEYHSLRAFAHNMSATEQLNAAVKRYLQLMWRFYKAATAKSDAKQCAQWRDLQAELAEERVARHLSWLRAQCKKAITDLQCP